MTIETINGNLPVPAAKTPVPLAKPLADLDQAWRLAGTLARANLLPKGLRANNPEQTQANVAMILMYGAELGISGMQALQEIYVVNGRPQISGRLWLAKVRDAGHRVEKLEHTAERCVIKIVRGDTGEEWTEEFTIQDAQRALLAKKDTYQQHPKRMLLWRAVANCASAICPEVAMGFGAEDPEPEETAPAALARAVDARQPVAAAADDDVADAVVIEEPTAEDLAADDEAARNEVLSLAAGQADDEGNPLAYTPEEIEEGGGWR